MINRRILFLIFSLFSTKIEHGLCYFWSNDIVSSKARSLIPPPSSPTNTNTPSNLGCFMCTQLLSVTKHRVGLSENQLRNQLYEKCRVLPSVFKEQCFAFVETSLPEIYYSINYDLSSKDVCVRMNFCDQSNPFAVGGPLPPIAPTTSEPFGEEEEETPTPPRKPFTTPTPQQYVIRNEKKAEMDRIGHKNILELVLPEDGPNHIDSREKSSKEKEDILDDKQLTCSFCERMLENAKNYATDITNFANSACSSLPKGRNSDQCYQMADKKIAELAKFVDQQVVDALWCAELNRC